MFFVVLNLRQDESLFEVGVAHKVVNRIQKSRKKAGLEPTGMVVVYFESLDKDNASPSNLAVELHCSIVVAMDNNL
ncbi:hypothetical protein V6N13_108430 [Hibiscus sabdariffa]